MNKRNFFIKMEDMQTELDAMRQGLYEDINSMFALRKKKILFSEDQPLLYHEGDTIIVEGFIDEGTVFGKGDNGQAWDVDIAELGIDDVKMLAMRLAQEVF